MLARTWRNWDTPTLLVGMHQAAIAVEKALAGAVSGKTVG